MRETYHYILRPLMVIAIATAVIVSSIYCCGGQPSGETRDTVTVTRVDTLHDTIRSVKPVPKDSTIVRYIKVPSECPAVPQPDSSQSDSLLLPVTQKVYSDSTYTAWISGVEPALDSIEVYRRTVNVYTDRTVTVPKQAPRFSIGLSGGVGIVGDLKGEYVRPGWYLGVGGTWRIGKR